MDPVSIAVIGVATQVLLQELYKSLTVINSFVFKDEFDRMKKKLSVMRSFLIDGQQQEKKYQNNLTLRTIFAELRDLVYDADDLVLDYQVRAAYEQEYPRRRYSHRGIQFRLTAESKLKLIIKHIDDMEKKFLIYLHPMAAMINHDDKETTPSTRQISRILSLSEPVGLEDDAQKILKWITTDEKSCQIAIVGMGGSGKTTIARKIYDDKDIAKHFDKRIWVTVSDPHRNEDVLANMWNQIRANKNKWKVDETLSAEGIMFQICQSLTNKKYLVVMDGVWKMDYSWWRTLTGRLPKENRSKSSIMITTRDERVAKGMGATNIHKARKLDKDESWSLFHAIAFLGKENMVASHEFQKIGKEIVKKCKGLPLAIKTKAGILLTKSHSLHEWSQVSVNFSRELETQNTVLATFRPSYDDLPSTLKHCIMCFSVYPEDAEIDAEQLVFWWVSEGFVQGTNTGSAIDVAFQCLGELVSRCLVEAVEKRGYDGRVKKCKMHEMVRDLVIKISKDEKFCSFDEESKHVADLDSRHLGYTSGMDLELLKNNTKLRSFLLVKNSSFTFHPALETVNSLRVLDLSSQLHKVCVNDCVSWIKSQERLAYLNLQGVDDLEELTDWMKGRQNLKVLVMKDCKNFKKLPPSFIYLQNLLVLDIENCPLEFLPQGFARLKTLQVLKGFKLTKQDKKFNIFGELRNMTKLRVLGIKLSENDEISDGEGYVLTVYLN